MTIGIGAISKTGIIFVTDSMISTDSFSSDTAAFKLVSLHADWKALWAGNDLTRLNPFCRRVTQAFADKGIAESPCPFTAVESAIRDSWKAELKQRIEDKYLSRYQMTVEDFVRDGEKCFGSQYQAMKYQIDTTELGFELLIGGYDVLGTPHLMSVADPGEISHHTAYKFWAIGSGANAALSHYFSYEKPVFTDDHGKVFYRCIAAKFAAETAPGVGKATLFVVINGDGTVTTSPHHAEDLRSIWLVHGVPKEPQVCLTSAQAVLAKSRTTAKKGSKPSDSQTSGDQQ
jgi:20S proteasome alpha/beta subunit